MVEIKVEFIRSVLMTHSLRYFYKATSKDWDSSMKTALGNILFQNKSQR